ncbi:MAG: radical SAM protein [Bacteroidales bacterium]
MNSPKINHIICKVASICNLSCDYCYVFNKQDQSYKLQTNLMSLIVANTFIMRLEEYLSINAAANVSITFHGGEPLLEDKSFYVRIAQKLEKYNSRVFLNIQTNGTLIDEDWCRIFNQFNFSVGISIDGDEQANMCRRYKDGIFAHKQIMNGYKLLVKNKVNHGILSVINIHISPKQFYDYFKSIGASYIDCLLPDANYETYNSSNNGVGMWLCQLFDIWFGDKERFSIRLFESIIKLILQPDCTVGGEMFGNTENGVIDINPNGDIDVPDTLRICNIKLKNKDYSIFYNHLTDICDEEIFQKFYYSHSDNYISSKCRLCVIRKICEGGLLAHRFSKQKQFNNPSVYCHELFLLVMQIQRKLCSQIKETIIDKIEINDFNAW